MVIVPTEKKFDWNHAPVVLFAIALLNILVFFLYQTGDVKKIDSALERYETQGFFEQEWPLFQDYLTERNETSLLEELNEYHAAGHHQEVILTLLVRTDFYDHLSLMGLSVFYESYYNSWRYPRQEINDQVLSLSFKKGGLSSYDFNVFNLLTYQFLHGDIMHLLGNLFFLVICGFAVEAALGQLRFLAAYLISGIVAGLAHIIVDDGVSPLVGASGAVSGVMAMYLAVFKLRKIEFFYWIFFFVGYFRAPALFILPIFIGKELVEYFFGGDSNVAFMAHVGGFVSGALLMYGSQLLDPQMLNRDYIEKNQDSDPHQEKLAKIYGALEKFQFDTALINLDTLIESDGLTFELARLRCNLLKLTHDDRHLDSVKDLLLLDSSEQNELEKVEKFWLEYGKEIESLNNEQKLHLGLRLVTLPDPNTAIDLFEQLLQQDFKHRLLGVFAKKISKACEGLNRFKEKEKYSEIAENLLGFR